jgi:hypothetical protein
LPRRFSLWHGAAAVSQGRKIFQGVKLAGGIVATANGSEDTSGIGTASTVTGVASIAVAFAPKIAKAIPGIGQVLAAGSLGLDAIHLGLDIRKCY